MSARRAALASLVLVIATMGSLERAHATRLRALSLPELVAASELVVHARVAETSERVRRVRGRLEPVTTTRFTAIEALRGRAQPVELEAPIGADAHGVTRHVLGWPRFTPREEAVLFLRRDAGAYALVGMGQGVFYVQRRGAEPAVCMRRLEEVELVGETSIPERIALEDLREAVRRLGATP